MGSVARPFAIAAFISALPELRSITGERSCARTAAPVGEPRIASTAAKAAATTHLEPVEKAEFIVAISHRIPIRNPGSWSHEAAREFTPSHHEGASLLPFPLVTSLQRTGEGQPAAHAPAAGGDVHFVGRGGKSAWITVEAAAPTMQ